MNISDQLQAINTEKQAQKAVLTAKGVDMTDVPFTQYHDRIASITTGGNGGSSGEWIRPADRPPVPTIGENEQVIYWLFGVQQDSPNDFAITLSTSAGKYRIEWGDGTYNDYNSAAKAEHLFSYADIQVEPNEQGYKWVLIKAYPLTGNFTVVNINVRHSSRPTGSSSNIFVPQVFEWYMRAPFVTSFAFSKTIYTRYLLLDLLEYYGTNSITSFAYFLYAWRNLKKLNIDTSSGTNFRYFMYNCYSFNQPLNIDTSSSISFSGFMSSCTSFNQPLNIDTSNSADFNNFMTACYSFNQPLNIDTSSSMNFSDFMTDCHSFNQPLNIDTSSSMSFSDFMYNCYSFNQPLNINTRNSTYFKNFMYNCYSFNQPLNIDTSSGRDFGYFMYNCASFNQPLNIDTSSGTGFNYFMYGCVSFNQPLNIDTSSGISFSGFMSTCNSFNKCISIYLNKATVAIGTSFIGTACFALKGLRLHNMGTVHTALTISNSSLDSDALEALFGDLPNRTGLTAGTITITNVFGASRLTAAQRAIATSKNWDIVG